MTVLLALVLAGLVLLGLASLLEWVDDGNSRMPMGLASLLA